MTRVVALGLCGIVLVWASLAITLISSFHYIWHARRIIDAPAPAAPTP